MTMPAPTFEQILDDVATSEAAVAAGNAGIRSSAGFWSAFARIAPPRSARAARRMPATPEPMDTPEPAQPPSIEPADIAAELDLRPGMTAAQLQGVRRAFARRNHPDGYGHDFPAESTVRMQIANALIDRALKTVQR
ncbi:hypothetical protein VQ042_02900 [Aurantimonas sp. A2-1-M11]|uniref:hypothetical protein n=1 Tax=Aurantimonas sp. A2-1-M11 TaxID=3113712 RepID=UPI002F95769F